jgi:hypothetical protein
LVNLTPSVDISKPTLMTLPDSVEELLWVKYNKHRLNEDDLWSPVQYKPLEEFLFNNSYLKESDPDVGSFTHTADGHTAKFYYRKDYAPNYYTTFDDYTLIFDAYDSGVDSTLQSAKTQGYAKLSVEFQLQDNFILDLDDTQIPLLFNEAKSLAWAEMKQTQNAKAEQSARRGWVKLQSSQDRVKKTSFFDTLPNYGRHRRP